MLNEQSMASANRAEAAKGRTLEYARMNLASEVAREDRALKNLEVKKADDRHASAMASAVKDREIEIAKHQAEIEKTTIEANANLMALRGQGHIITNQMDRIVTTVLTKSGHIDKETGYASVGVSRPESTIVTGDGTGISMSEEFVNYVHGAAYRADASGPGYRQGEIVINHGGKVVKATEDNLSKIYSEQMTAHKLGLAAAQKDPGYAMFGDKVNERQDKLAFNFDNGVSTSSGTDSIKVEADIRLGSRDDAIFDGYVKIQDAILSNRGHELFHGDDGMTEEVMKVVAEDGIEAGVSFIMTNKLDTRSINFSAEIDLGSLRGRGSNPRVNIEDIHEFMISHRYVSIGGGEFRPALPNDPANVQVGGEVVFRAKLTTLLENYSRSFAEGATMVGPLGVVAKRFNSPYSDRQIVEPDVPLVRQISASLSKAGDEYSTLKTNLEQLEQTISMSEQAIERVRNTSSDLTP